MKLQLHAFYSTEHELNIDFFCNVDRHKNQLELNYQLMGDLQTIFIPQAFDRPTRQDELWRETCFEFFLGVENTSDYWEFNLSPSGHWNVYYFEDYRQGMQREAAFVELPFKVDRQPNRLILALKVDLEKIGLADRNLQVAITAVIKQTDETVTYWALTHTGSQPDFHSRESFLYEC
ncbi:MAG: DOMON-like domain-containing protein [Geitlerinemataceae cyanobacterium]